jgi:hypothetical protein
MRCLTCRRTIAASGGDGRGPMVDTRGRQRCDGLGHPHVPPAAFVASMVGRVHVSTAPRDVIAHVRAALAPEVRDDPAMREQRHAVYRAALHYHARNRAMYDAVVTGRL